MLARVAAWAAIVAAIGVFIWQGVVFWTAHPHMSAAECLYNDAPCSTAAATWGLAAFAFCSFVAAIEAIFWTAQLFGIEVKPKLGQSECTHHGEDHPADLETYVLSDGLIVPDKTAIGITDEMLANDYNRHDVAFINLGRNALVNVTVGMQLGDDDELFEMHLGNIVRDKETHIAVFVSKVLGNITVSWREARQDGKTIDFFPKAQALRFERDLADNQLTLPGMGDGGNTP